MHIKSILAGTAMTLAAGIGTASAAEQFTTLDGVAAVPMTSEHMGAIRGAATFPPGVVLIVPGDGGAVVFPGGANPASPPPLVIVDGNVVAGG